MKDVDDVDELLEKRKQEDVENTRREQEENSKRAALYAFYSLSHPHLREELKRTVGDALYFGLLEQFENHLRGQEMINRKYKPVEKSPKEQKEELEEQMQYVSRLSGRRMVKII
jgi:hypothetical protein